MTRLKMQNCSETKMWGEANECARGTQKKKTYPIRKHLNEVIKIKKGQAKSNGIAKNVQLSRNS